MLCDCDGSYWSKAVAVQTVSMVIPLNPEMTVGDLNVSILVAQSPVKSKAENKNIDHVFSTFIGRLKQTC